MDQNELDLETEKLAVDRHFRSLDIRLRRTELKLKEEELRRTRWNNPLTVAIFVAAVGLIGNFGVTAWQTYNSLKATNLKAIHDLELERDKARSDLIFQAVKADPDQATSNLIFLISARILDDPKDQIKSALKGGFRPATSQTVTSSSDKPSVGPEQVLKIYSSGPKLSGAGSTFSSPYDICSGPLEGYHVSTTAFALSGDRSCGSYSTCRETVHTDRQVCWAFTLQGHNELPSPGQAQSEGTLQVVWNRDK
jgi:hypothetical protein